MIYAIFTGVVQEISGAPLEELEELEEPEMAMAE
jgi:hypothetical protein